LSPLDDKFQRGLIITDDISLAPILDFDYYKQVITDIIKKSYPKFSIGIFGEWGTGKTTLMKNVYNELEKKRIQSVVPVWFNAWRYERENQFALFPLLQTIAYSIPDKDKEKEILKEAIGKFGRGFLKGLIKSIPEFASAVLPSAISEPLKKTRDNVANEISIEFMSMLDKISQNIISGTLYSNHLENIETAIADIRKNEDFKIVVFIDDLDRCLPTKALEVLESTKVFLDLDGFIFVMGLSYNKISQLITAADAVNLR
jgi:predicted KAP-like P-loop ATPase